MFLSFEGGTWICLPSSLGQDLECGGVGSRQSLQKDILNFLTIWSQEQDWVLPVCTTKGSKESTHTEWEVWLKKHSINLPCTQESGF